MSKLALRHLPRRLGAGLAVVIAVAAVVGIVLAVGSPSSTNGATNSGGVSGATTVQRRNLVQTDTESGMLSYAKPQTVYNRLSGTITWLPPVGHVIKPGQALYRVSGQPVVLMNGTTPAYRDLSAADSAGPDILQLNRDLVQLGFNSEGIVVDNVWQPATTAAVEVFQQSQGETPTGVLTLGQVVFLPGTQVVSTLDATLGSSGGGGGSGSIAGSTTASTVPRSSSAQFVSLATTTTGTTGTTSTSGPKSRSTAQTGNTLAALLALLKAQSAQLKAETAELKAARQASANSPNSSGKATTGGSSPSAKSAGGSNTAGSANSGTAGATGTAGGGGSATAILQTSSTQLVATVNLDASKQSEAKMGEKVTVQLPAGNTVNGTITAVSSVAQTSNSSGSGNGSAGSNSSANSNSNGNSSSTPTIPVTISLAGRPSGAGLDQAAVSVNFAQAKATNVLSVPVTALLATSGGGYAVQAATAPHRLVPVSTGLFAAGYVEISGSGIYPGLQVTDSQG